MNTELKTETLYDKAAVHKLHSLARDLYGDNWIRPLADDMGMRQKSVQDWSTGANVTFTLDHWFWKRVPVLREIKQHRDAIAVLRRKLKG